MSGEGYAWPAGGSGGGSMPATKLSTAGATQNGSWGTSVATGAGSGFTAWTQLIASTAADCYLTGLYYECSGARNTGGSYLQIGVGASGSESSVHEQLISLNNTTPLSVPILPWPRVASGVRISFRIFLPTTGTNVTCYCAVASVPYANLEGH